MNVLCLNIQGLLNNFVELKYVLKKRRPDICLLNETHVTEDVMDTEIKIRGYHLIRSNSHSTSTGGAVAYINDKLKFSNVKTESNDVAWLTMFDLTTKNSIVTIAGIYLSAETSKKRRVLDWFGSFCENNCENNDIMITGDFNIDVSKSTEHSDRFIRICNDNGLKQLINTPTRVTSNTSTIIDLCCTNIRHVVALQIDEDQISDHYQLKGPLNKKQKLKR